MRTQDRPISHPKRFYNPTRRRRVTAIHSPIRRHVNSILQHSLKAKYNTFTTTNNLQRPTNSRNQIRSNRPSTLLFRFQTSHNRRSYRHIFNHSMKQTSRRQHRPNSQASRRRPSTNFLRTQRHYLNRKCHPRVHSIRSLTIRNRIIINRQSSNQGANTISRRISTTLLISSTHRSTNRLLIINRVTTPRAQITKTHDERIRPSRIMTTHNRHISRTTTSLAHHTNSRHSPIDRNIQPKESRAPLK